MDPRDLPPLRAGLGGIGTTLEPSPELMETERRLIATVATMTQKAGLLAYKVCVHDSREEVSADDVNRALKHQARHFLQMLDDPDVQQEISIMQRAIFEAASDSSESSESGGEYDAFDTLVRETKAVENGKCVCDICVQVRAAADSWATWTPEDEIEQYLQRSVNRAIAAAQQRTK